MATYETKNRGVAFIGEKTGNPRRPDWRGSLNVEGKDYWLSIWNREAKKDGAPYLSLTIEAKRERPVVEDESEKLAFAAKKDFDDGTSGLPF